LIILGEKRICFKTKKLRDTPCGKDCIHETPRLQIGSVGTFQFDGKVSTFDNNDRLIMGLPNTGVASYEDVLLCIDVKDKTRFEETTLGIKTKAPIVKFDSIQLANGNIIQDTHFREFNEDGTLKYLEGYTKLVGVA